jgi:hypothetical protein
MTFVLVIKATNMGRLGILICIVPCIAVWAFMNQKCANFDCPRCKMRFYELQLGGFGYNVFSRRCHNCHLKKWDCNGLSKQDSDALA